MPTSRKRRNAPRKQHRADRQRTGKPPRNPPFRDIHGVMTGYLIAAAVEQRPYQFRSHGDIEFTTTGTGAGKVMEWVGFAEKYDMGNIPLVVTERGYAIPVPPDDEMAAWANGTTRAGLADWIWYEFLMPGDVDTRHGYLIGQEDNGWFLYVFKFDRLKGEFYWDGFRRTVTNRSELIDGETEIKFALSGRSQVSIDETLSDPEEVSQILSELRLSIMLAVLLPHARSKIYIEKETVFDRHWRVDFIGPTKGHTPETLAAMTWGDLDLVEPADAEKWRIIMGVMRREFRERFGRDPRADDPFTCDPDAPTPTRVSVEKVRSDFLKMMNADGWSSAKSYAFAKTGLMIMDENVHLHTPEQIAQWSAALAEYAETETTH